MRDIMTPVIAVILLALGAWGWLTGLSGWGWWVFAACVFAIQD